MIKTVYSQFLISLLALTFISSASQAGLLYQQQMYVAQERYAMECAVALERTELWAMVPFASQGKRKKVGDSLFDTLAAADCQIYPNQVNKPFTRGDTFLPYYSEIPEDINTLACASLNFEDYKACEFAREDYLKPFFLKEKDVCETVPNDEVILTNGDYWHNYLINNGYPCTAKEFRQANMNIKRNSEFQASLDESTANIKSIMEDKPLAGLTLALVPPLAYERSYFQDAPYSFFGGSGGAKVSPQKMSSRLRRLGAKVYFIDRVTSAPLKQQIKQTYPELRKINKAEKDGFVILSWSFGSAVVAKILRDHEDKLNNLKGVVLYASTPHGSVIGEYKSRLDYFMKRHALPNVEKAIKDSEKIDLLDDLDWRIPDTIDNSLISGMMRENLIGLSYNNPELHDPVRESQVKVPVINYVLLNPTEKERANDLRDPVYQNMIAYGPTEGSSRLVDVAFRSKDAVTVFLDDMGHLGFLYMDADKTTEVLTAPLVSARKLGYF